MLRTKLIIFTVFLTIVQLFGSAKLVPLVRRVPDSYNYLKELEFLKSQYEIFQKRVVPIYYMTRRDYTYDRPQIPFEYGPAGSGEIINAPEGYFYNTPDTPFTFPPKTTTEFPPASARSII